MALTKIKTDGIADEAVTLAKHAPTGSDGQVLTSTGAGTDPAFENLLTNGSDNRVVTASSSTTLNGESTLTYSDPELKIDTTEARGKVKLDGASGGEIIFTKDGTEKLHIYNSEQETRIESATGAANLMVKSGDGNNYAQLQLYPTGTGVAYINSHKDIVVWDGTNSVAHTTFKLGGDIQTTGGISFNPHVDGSATSPYSNVLDDYEEGAFTPTITRQYNSPIIGYDAQDGYYTKIGRVVYFYAELRISSYDGNGSYGLTYLNGLPFTSAARTGGRGVWNSVTYHSYFRDMTTTDGEKDIAVVAGNDSRVTFYIARSENSWATPPAPDANDQFKIGGYYFT